MRGRRRGEGGRALFLFTGGKLLHFLITSNEKTTEPENFKLQSKSLSERGGWFAKARK